MLLNKIFDINCIFDYINISEREAVHMLKKLILISFFLGIFICQAYATDWYVRPAGGNYGSNNGTSYANAWDGLKNVVWGAGGVQPGDTLYICGLHLFEWLPGTTGPDREIQMIGGSSGSARIRIRGDYAGDAGIIWGGALLKHESWVYEGNNTYSITSPATQNSHVWYFEDVTATSHTVLNKASSLTACKNNPGTHYSPDYKNPSKLYVHCSDNGDPTNRITENTLGWTFNMRDLSYITWENLKCYIPKVLFAYNAPTNFTSHITWRDCTIWYEDQILLLFRQRCNYITFDGCDLAWARNGLAFSEYPPGDGTTSPHHITVKNCTIHDIGVKVHDGDAHAISFQGGHDNLVEGNDCYNCGETICFYSYSNQRIWNNTVRYNYIHDNHNSGGLSPGRGICFNIGSGRPLNDNNKIYGNIVANLVDGGIKASWSYLTEIYNNVVYNCFFSYRLSNTQYEIDMHFKNNISIYPRSQHLIVQTAANEGNYVFESENNIYYPISGDQFTFDDGDQNPFVTNFAGWRTISKSGCIFDQNSLTVNPRLTNGSGSFSSDNDFRLQSNSPAIDSGVDVGISQDYMGTAVPLGFAPDIGPYESIKIIYTRTNANPDSGDIPLTVNFSGDAIGDYPPFTYSWNFGDGGSSSAQNPNHTYNSEGTYTATLTVSDNSNNQETSSETIIAHSPIKSLSISAVTGPPSGNGGTTNPIPGVHLYSRGSVAQTNAIPYLNFRFSKWNGDVIASDIFTKNISITMDRDKSISAHFCTICGDINGDLSITASDAQAAFEIFLGKISNPTECQLENADVNCDGTKSNPLVTPSDAQAIFEKFLGRYELPCNCSGNLRTNTQNRQKSQSAEFTLILSDLQPKPGQEVHIPVVVDKTTNLNAFGFDLLFPSESFEFVTIENTELSKNFGYVDANEIAQGILRIGGYKKKLLGANAAGVLVILIFRSKENIESLPSFQILQTFDNIKGPSLRKEKQIIRKYRL